MVRKAKKTMIDWRELVRTMLWIAVIVLLGTMCASLLETDPTPPTTQKVHISTSVIQLSKDYNANEVQGDVYYKGKALVINGTVESVTIVDGEPVVILGAHWGREVHAKNVSPGHASRLKRGDKVAFLCTGGGVVNKIPVLTSCIPP